MGGTRQPSPNCDQFGYPDIPSIQLPLSVHWCRSSTPACQAGGVGALPAWTARFAICDLRGGVCGDHQGGSRVLIADLPSPIADRAGRRTHRAARRTDGDHGVEVSIRLCESRGMGANPIGPPNPPPTELVNRTVCKTVSAGCNSQGGVQFSCLTHRRRWSITISPYQLLRGVPATVF